MIINDLSLINKSTEFRNAEINDPINYKINYRSIKESSEVPSRYVQKPRKIVERQSIGAFRIDGSSLKKRVNPSDVYEAEQRKQMMEQEQERKKREEEQLRQSEELFTYSSNYTPVLYNDKRKTNSNFDDIENYSSSINPNQPAGYNLISVIDSKLRDLKNETEEELKYLKKDEEEEKPKAELMNEPKVDNQFIAVGNDYYQMLKHVKTRQKPEYMSLEELQKEKEENAKRLVELEKKYKESKSLDMQKMKEEEEKLNKKYNYKPTITLDELNQILSKENEIFDFESKIKKRKRPRTSDTRGRNPLGKKEEKFVQNLAKYKVKKKIQLMNEESKGKVTKSNEWNNTRIGSKNINGAVNRSDNLPGYFGKEDHGLYYCDIPYDEYQDKGKFNPPHWNNDLAREQHKEKMERLLNLSYNKKTNLSPMRVRNNRSVSKSPKNHRPRIPNDDVQEAVQVQEVKPPEEKHEEPNAPEDHPAVENPAADEKEEAFVKLVFDKIDVQNIGYVTKSKLCTEINLDYDTLSPLHFSSKQEFVDLLEAFETKLYNHLSKEDLRQFLVNQRLKFERQQREEEEKAKEKEKEEKKEAQPEPEMDQQEFLESMQGYNEDDDDYLPVFNTRDILRNSSNAKRLEVLQTIMKKQCPEELEKPKEKEKKRPESSRVVTYKDYKNIINKYSDKDDINFTIPKPFSFNKSKKSLSKMKTLLEERQRKEDEELGKGFRANKLKNEMFIGGVDTIIEAEKRERQRRVEKRMEKIQKEMKPFSFYDKDEKKLKEKRERIQQYENTKMQFPKFKANSVKWTTKVAILENIEKKEANERKERVEKKAKELYEKSKLPPRLEQHEREKKMRLETEAKAKKANKKKAKKFDPTIKLPDYDKLQKRFEKKILDDKNARPKTKVEPFEFHKPKNDLAEKKYQEIMEEQNKFPDFKRRVLEEISKMNRISSAQPSSNKTMDLRLQERRMNEEKKKKEEERRKMEDKQRKIDQQRLKKRVQGSKRLENTEKEDLIKEKERREQFRKGLREKEKEHQDYINIIKQKNCNGPLMFEKKDVGEEPEVLKHQRMRDAIREGEEDSEDEEDEKDERNESGHQDREGQEEEEEDPKRSRNEGEYQDRKEKIKKKEKTQKPSEDENENQSREAEEDNQERSENENENENDKEYQSREAEEDNQGRSENENDNDNDNENDKEYQSREVREEIQKSPKNKHQSREAREEDQESPENENENENEHQSREGQEDVREPSENENEHQNREGQEEIQEQLENENKHQNRERQEENNKHQTREGQEDAREPSENENEHQSREGREEIQEQPENENKHQTREGQEDVREPSENENEHQNREGQEEIQEQLENENKHQNRERQEETREQPENENKHQNRGEEEGSIEEEIYDDQVNY